MIKNLLTGLLFFFSAIVFAEAHDRNMNHDQEKTISCRDTTPVAIPGAFFNRAAFYKAMEGNNKQWVIEQLDLMPTAPVEIREAFNGAMLMKKAGMGGSAPSKLKAFKQGHKMLEAAIRKDPKNTEFRFLRLVVQEHAPSVLGYHNNTGEDSDFIRLHYKTLPDEVQQFIVAYSKKSKILKLEVS